MNRQQFLAELNHYLTFFSPEERAKVIADYNDKFDSAGPECEAALLAQLGTPMTTAIDLKRRLEAGEKVVLDTGNPCQDAHDSPLSEYNVETETEESLNESEDAGKEPLSEAPVEDIPPEKPVKKKPSRAKFVFALIGSTILSIIIAAFFLAIAAVGVMLVVAMGYLLLTGLQNLLYITDALLLFGGGLVCGGFGLIIIWFAVWSAISLILKLYRSAGRHHPSAYDEECDA